MSAAHVELFEAFTSAGRLLDALQVLDRGEERNLTLPTGLTFRSVRSQIEQSQRLVERLPRLVRGEEEFSSSQEMIECVKLCRNRGDYYMATQLATKETDLSFGETVLLAECAAAAMEGGGDAASLDDGFRMDLQRKAMGWLRKAVTTLIADRSLDDTDIVRSLSTLKSNPRFAQFFDADTDVGASRELWQEISAFQARIKQCIDERPDTQVLTAVEEVNFEMPSLQNSGLFLQANREFARAEVAQRKAFALKKELFGDEHVVVANAMVALGRLAQQQGRLDEAESLYREAIAMREKLLGGTHAGVADGLELLASCLVSSGRLAAAFDALHRAQALREQLHGTHHVLYELTTDRMNEVANLQYKSKRLDLVQTVYGPGLQGCCSVAVERNGEMVYATGWNANAISAFSRDTQTGRLTLIQTLLDNEDLRNIVSVDLSDSYCLTASQLGKTVVMFKRNDDGMLEVAERYEGAFDRPQEPRFSPDGRFIYCADSILRGPEGSQGALVVLRRDGTSLHHVETLFGSESCFADIRGITFHPNRPIPLCSITAW